jgi:hypothetical protein
MGIEAAMNRLLTDILGGADPYTVAIRTIRTTIQAALAAMIAAGITNATAIEAAGFSALTAVVTAVYNLMLPTRDGEDDA